MNKFDTIYREKYSLVWVKYSSKGIKWKEMFRVLEFKNSIYI